MKIEADTYQSQISPGRKVAARSIFRGSIKSFPTRKFFSKRSFFPPINRSRGWTKSTKWRQHITNSPNFQELKGISFTLGKLNSFRDSFRYFNELAEFLWSILFRQIIVRAGCFDDLNVRINIFSFFFFCFSCNLFSRIIMTMDGWKGILCFYFSNFFSIFFWWFRIF